MARIGSIAAVGLLVLAAGCGGSASGGSESGGAAAGTAKDVSAVDPCDLLTAAQLGQVGLGSATARATETGPLRSCQWTIPGSNVATSVMLTEGADLAAFADGLTGVGAVEETELGGYPALRSPSEGSEVCSVIVEVAAAVVVSVLGSQGCPATERTAELVLTNLAS